MTRGRSRFLISFLVLGFAAGCRPKPTEQIPVIDLSLGNYFFHGPDTIPAGTVAFRLNLLGTDAHVMELILLTQDKRLKDLMEAGEGAFDSSWVTPVGGGVTATETNSPTYTMQLVPGRYVMLCYFGDSTHVPHFAKGMIKEFVVAGAEPPHATLPADLQVALVDYDYNFATPLTAGTHSLRAINTSQQPHEMIIARLKEGYTIEQAKAYDDSEAPKGPSPWEKHGGVGGLEPGDTIVMSAAFPKGTYQLYCYFRGAGETQNHYQSGMHKIITVD